MQARRTFRIAAVLAGTLVAIATVGSAAQANEAREVDYAVIQFADLHGVKNWRAEGNTAMLIEAYNNHWYRATFFAPCTELPWHLGVGFVTEPNGQLDRFSSIIVGGERCFFKTFEEVPAPE